MIIFPFGADIKRSDAMLARLSEPLTFKSINKSNTEYRKVGFK